MKLTFDQQAAALKHERIVGFVKEIIHSNPGYDESLLNPVRDYVQSLLDRYGYPEIKQHISVGSFEFYEAARDYKDEILYVMEEHGKRFDPSWKHRLMSTKISDMTGYEYKTFLELIQPASDQAVNGD